mmetsp:Transcript_82283/g.233313  ORF Transcript_82283/g.233313 Transcript_82283/m.233313 type:complete len:157 (+) Transcript_82283:27-497(+)
MLQQVDTERLLLLMENTNTDFVVKLSATASELALVKDHMAPVADTLGRAMQKPAFASTVSRTTDLIEKASRNYKKAKVQGMMARGGTGEGDPAFGDLTRGLMMKTQKKVNKMLARSRGSSGNDDPASEGMPQSPCRSSSSGTEGSADGGAGGTVHI